MKGKSSAAWLAWFLAAFYYAYPYALRSSPAVMMPQLSEAPGLTTVGVASLVSLLYHGYSPFAPVTRATIDRPGVRTLSPVGALMTAIGAVLFPTLSLVAANVGRFLRGAGGVLSFVGAVYIIGRYLPASFAAAVIGTPQMIGMAGGSAGQFLVGPLLVRGIAWDRLWIYMGLFGVLLAATLWVALPEEKLQRTKSTWLKVPATDLAIFAKNPQSILCGVIAGLLFLPTNILHMVRGVRFPQEAHGFDYGQGVLRSAMAPLVWIIGCTLLGLFSDRLGRRKPAIIGGACILLACLAWMLCGDAAVFPAYVIGIAAGIASGSATIPYPVIKEANAPELNGTAAGLRNFICFTVSALTGPVFGWVMESVAGAMPDLEHYQIIFHPFLYGVGLAIALMLLLKETGLKMRVSVRIARAA